MTGIQALCGVAVRRAQAPLRAHRQAQLATKAAVKTDSAYTAEARVSAGSHLTEYRRPYGLLHQSVHVITFTAVMQAVCLLS